MKSNNEDAINLDSNTKISDEVLNKFLEKYSDDIFKSSCIPIDFISIPTWRL